MPKDFDGSVLIGRTLEMVCFNINQIYLHFSDHAMVTIASTLVYYNSADKTVQERLSPPVAETGLMRLIGHSLINVSGTPDGTLTLLFDNEQSIECLDISSNYESYQINFDDTTIIV